MASIIYKGTNGVGGGSGNTIYAFSDGAYTWQTIAADTTAQDNYAYLVDDPDPVVISPPNSPNVGDTFLAMSINGVVAFDFKINGEYNADILKAIQIESINTPFRFFYTGATYGWVCENANEFGTYSTSDPYFNNIVLFIKGDGVDGSTNIIDESPTPKTVSVFGNTQISTTQSKYGGSSIKFPGSTASFLSVVDSDDLSLLNSDFTLEWWQYCLATTGYILGKGDAATAAGSELSFVASGSRTIYYNGGGTASLSIASVVNTWEHIAIVRNGTSLNAYKNGIEVSSTTFIAGASINNTAQPLKIGAYATGALNGYIDSLRITKGVARYTTTFDPETDTYLSYPTVAPPSDPYIDNVVLHLKGDDVDGSTAIVDESPTPKTISVFGTAQISTAQSKYGGSSIYLNGSGNYLSTPATADFLFGTGDFTVEGWINTASLLFQNSFYRRVFVSAYNGSSSGVVIQLRGSSTSAMNTVSVGYGDPELILATCPNLLGQWFHLAVVRASGTLYVFTNGTLAGSVANSTNIAAQSSSFYVGRLSAGFDLWAHNGYFDSIRITKGVGRYTANFDPETDTYLAY